jgi:hypothetical protein
MLPYALIAGAHPLMTQMAAPTKYDRFEFVPVSFLAIVTSRREILAKLEL